MLVMVYTIIRRVWWRHMVRVLLNPIDVIGDPCIDAGISFFGTTLAKGDNALDNILFGIIFGRTHQRPTRVPSTRIQIALYVASANHFHRIKRMSIVWAIFIFQHFQIQFLQVVGVFRIGTCISPSHYYTIVNISFHWGVWQANIVHFFWVWDFFIQLY